MHSYNQNSETFFFCRQKWSSRKLLPPKIYSIKEKKRNDNKQTEGPNQTSLIRNKPKIRLTYFVYLSETENASLLRFVCLRNEIERELLINLYHYIKVIYT